MRDVCALYLGVLSENNASIPFIFDRRMINLSEQKVCLLIYLLIACPALFAISVITPQFHVPDENQHYIRAYQVYKGNYFPQKHHPPQSDDYVVGGRVDIGIIKYNNIITSIAFDSERKISAELRKKAERMVWHGDHWYTSPNVAIYPPFLYIPSALGIYISKHLNLTIAKSVTVSRWCNLIIGILLASLAIALSRDSAFFVTTVLLFPMMMAQMASVSQDALMLPAATLFVVLLYQICGCSDRIRVGLFSMLAALLLILLSTSRPPYAALGLLIGVAGLSAANGDRRLICLSASLISIVASFGWAYYVARNVSIPFGDPAVSYSEQLGFILAEPDRFTATLLGTIGQKWKIWFDQMIGVLGWLDTRLPGGFYPFAAINVILSMTLYCVEKRDILVGEKLLLMKSLSTAILVFTFFGILVVMYMVWTPVGLDEIVGVQGRYMLPLLLGITLLLYTPETGVRLTRLAYTRLGLVAVFGVVGSIATLTTLVERYYP